LDTPFNFKNTAELALTEIGPYAAEITVYDIAGNYKTARRIFMFDNESLVTLYDPPAKVTNVEGDSGWITKDDGFTELIWPGRFSNDHHDMQCWLCQVKSGDISIDLEDTDGKSGRTIEAIPNVKGLENALFNLH